MMKENIRLQKAKALTAVEEANHSFKTLVNEGNEGDIGTEEELLSSCLRSFFRGVFDDCKSLCLLFPIEVAHASILVSMILHICAFLLASIFQEFDDME